MMKAIVKRAIKDEKGAALALALVLLVVGGLILTPLLGLMSTGLLAGQAYERHTDRLYAADAGVEDAIWKIQTHNLKFGTNNWSEPWHLTANGKNVTIVVYREDLDPYCGEEFMYRILSTAASDDGGGTAAIGTPTTIDAYLAVSAMNLSYMLDYAIISNSTIEIQPNNFVDGDVWLPDGSQLSDPKEAINGTVDDSSTVGLTWPNAEDVSSYYWDQVNDLEPSTDDQIDIPEDTGENAPFIIPRLSSVPSGGKLTVNGDGWIGLGGTIYVKGNLLLKAQPQINIDLNGKTIFAEGWINIPPGVTLSGSGCIIAVGDVTFKPNMATEEDDFVLVMSVTGMTTLLPNGTFTGCVAGSEVVQLQPGDPNDPFTVQWIDPEEAELNFPGLNETNPDDLLITGLRIESWEINPE